jgi:MFS family permease
MGVLAAAPVLGWGVWPLYVSRAVGGACYGFYTAGYAYIADISRAEDRSKNFGALGTSSVRSARFARRPAAHRGLERMCANRAGIATGLGFMAGPTVAGYLGEVRIAQKANRSRR